MSAIFGTIPDFRSVYTSPCLIPWEPVHKQETVGDGDAIHAASLEGPFSMNSIPCHSCSHRRPEHSTTGTYGHNIVLRVCQPRAHHSSLLHSLLDSRDSGKERGRIATSQNQSWMSTLSPPQDDRVAYTEEYTACSCFRSHSHVSIGKI